MKAFLVAKYLCSSVDVVFAFNDLRSFAFICVHLRSFADKYSLCGQGVIMGLPTVFGEDPKFLSVFICGLCFLNFVH